MKKLDPVLAVALLGILLLLVIGLGLVFLSLISPYTYIFSAIILLLSLGPIAEARGAF